MEPRRNWWSHGRYHKGFERKKSEVPKALMTLKNIPNKRLPSDLERYIAGFVDPDFGEMRAKAAAKQRQNDSAAYYAKLYTNPQKEIERTNRFFKPAAAAATARLSKSPTKKTEKTGKTGKKGSGRSRQNRPKTRKHAKKSHVTI